MKKVKKFLLSTLSLVLVAVLSVAGTLAYLQHEDSDVNVMTMGNVKIAQHEFERVEENGSYKIDTIDDRTSYVLQEFTQDKPLYPFVGEVNNGYDSIPVRLSQLGHNSRGGMDVFPAANVQDKFVVVENTGKSDAYVRTIVAFEAGSLTYDEFKKVINYSYHFTWIENMLAELVEIDGKNYFVVEFVYDGYEDIQHPNGVLTPGDYTYNSLAQVYMYDTATNEDVEAIDGNGNGKYDILVFSQAVQTKGFADAQTALDTAFGDITATNHPWVNYDFSNSVVTEEELNEKIKTQGIAKLESDIVLTDVTTIPFGKTATINLNGHDLSLKDNGGVMIGFNSTLIIEGEGNINFELFYIMNAFGEAIAKGGTYMEDPSSHLTIADGYKVVDNGNGTWTVKPE